ncbi:MAG: hypothetical protein KAG66_20005, partial [Methylococcales bacterium]|nr:hypothetical protein [Methylococcales bacterium]
GSSDPDGDDLAYRWAIIDAPVSSLASLSDPVAISPLFTADIAGIYTIELIVNDGNVDSAPDTVVIIAATGNEPPVADAGPDQNVSLGATVDLDGAASSDPDGDTLSYAWTLTSIPAGSTATLSDATIAMPTFVADMPGSYTAQLIVNDGVVDSAPDAVIISTANQAPLANAGPDASTAVGDSVSLDGSASSDPDGDTLSYSWSFTDIPVGSTATLSDTSIEAPTFAADLPGSYTVQLIVNDGVLDSGPDTVTISTDNRPPIAAAGPDAFPQVGDIVTLDGTASSDPDGDSLSYSWSLTSVPTGSAAVLLDATNAMPAFVADVAGSYIAELIVNDGNLNSIADEVIITTENRVPVADAGPDASTPVGTNVTLDGSASLDPDGDTLSFSWLLTAIPAGSSATLSDATTETPSFVADLPGSYTAQLIVNDGDMSSI